jgi:hypothetical protein
MMVGFPVASVRPDSASFGLFGMVPFCSRVPLTSPPGELPVVLPGWPSPLLPSVLLGTVDPGAVVVCPEDVPGIPGPVTTSPAALRQRRSHAEAESRDRH